MGFHAPARRAKKLYKLNCFATAYIDSLPYFILLLEADYIYTVMLDGFLSWNF